jgi:hypothetical protein
MLRLSRFAVYGMGVAIIVLAVVTHIWSLDLGEVFDWLETAFGPVYLVSYVALVAVAVYAATRLSDIHQGAVWLEAGQQAAAGIATLALTFTLLGISLGIESLSNHALSPETIQDVIRELTRHFSTAFLTTIVGLPTANGLRALLSIRWAALREQPQNQTASCRVPV